MRTFMRDLELLRSIAAALPLAALVGLSASPAGATGPCENIQSTLELVAVSKRGDRLIFEGTKGWCEEDDDGSEVTERRGEVPIALITDLDRNLEKTFYLERDSARTREALAMIGVDVSDDLAFADAYETFRDQGNVVGIDALGPSPSGACTIEIDHAPGGEDEYGFPTGTATWTLRAGAQTLLEETYHSVAITEEEVTVAPVFLATQRRLLLWIQVPRCVGGPPPGYFGEDDPGECYVDTQRELAVFDPAGHPTLAICFDHAEVMRENDHEGGAGNAGDAGPPEVTPPSKTKGCHVAPSPRGTLGVLVMLLLGVGVARRRRR